MRYRLRTLLIVLALGPMVLAALYCYPEVFGFVGAIVALTFLGAFIGRVFGMATEGGMLALTFLVLIPLLLPAVNRSGPSPTAATSITVHFFNDAIKSYRDKVGELPPDLESLLKRPRSLPANTDWGGPYLSYDKLPLDSWRGKFQYKLLDSEKGEFRVWSNGPDRRSQTNDDIYGW